MINLKKKITYKAFKLLIALGFDKPLSSIKRFTGGYQMIKTIHNLSDAEKNLMEEVKLAKSQFISYSSKALRLVELGYLKIVNYGCDKFLVRIQFDFKG